MTVTTINDPRLKRYDRVPPEIVEESRILAQAKAKRKDGLIHIVVVYEMSQEYRFFYEYTAKSTRTPRKKWTPAGWGIIHDARPYNGRGEKKPLDFDEYLSRKSFHVAIGAKWTKRYPYGKAKFASYLDLIGNPFKNMLPSEQRVEPGATFYYSEWKATGKKPRRSKEYYTPKPVIVTGK